ncbi:MAG TPA: hypothetical protein VGJ01_08725 [Pseudolabrys sp.]|jgi:hypothetical protein
MTIRRLITITASALAFIGAAHAGELKPVPPQKIDHASYASLYGGQGNYGDSYAYAFGFAPDAQSQNGSVNARASIDSWAQERR